MKTSKIIFLITLMGFVMLDAKAKQNNDKNTVSRPKITIYPYPNDEEQKAPRFDMNKIADRAKTLVEKKDGITKIVESCYELIDQLEHARGEQLYENNSRMTTPISDQELEDQLFNFVENKLFTMSKEFLNFNKKLAIEIVNNSHQPLRAVEVAA